MMSSTHSTPLRARLSIFVRCRSYQQRRTRCENQTPVNTSAFRPPDPYPDCKQATLQTSSKNDSRVWGGVGYSRSVATGGSARVATGKRRGGAGADRIGQDLHLRAALSEPENSGGVHRPDPRTR